MGGAMKLIIVSGDKIVLGLSPRTEHGAKDMASTWLKENCYNGARVTVYKAVSVIQLTETTQSFTEELEP